MTQRTAIVLDTSSYTTSVETERDEVLKDLRREGLDPEVVHYGHDPLQLPETQIDLLVVDYGALWQLDMGDWTRHLIRWADEHPSSLVVLWSGMTADFFVSEMGGMDELTGEFRDGATWPFNMRALHVGNTYSALRRGDPLGWRAEGFDSFAWYGDSLSFIQKWFGIEASRQEREVEASGPLTPPD